MSQQDSPSVLPEAPQDEPATVESLSVNAVIEALHEERLEDLKAPLLAAPPAGLARLVESLPPTERAQLWELLDAESAAEVLPYLHDDARTSIFEEMEDSELLATTEWMEAQEVVDVIDDLSDERGQILIDSLEADNRARVESLLAFEEGTAGRHLTSSHLSIRADVQVDVALRWLRLRSGVAEDLDCLWVVDPEGRLIGRAPLAVLVAANSSALLSEVMDADPPSILGSATDHEIVAHFEQYLQPSTAVVDEQGLLVGSIEMAEAIGLLREEADHSLLKSAGLDEDADLFAPVLPSARRRGVWLGINLLTVLLAAWMIGRFQAALDEIVALAVLMPIVASMGGIAGSQTLTLAIRGLALDQIQSKNIRWLTGKEFGVALLNGSFWALVIGGITWLWFRSGPLAAVIAAATLVNVISAVLAGVIVPFALKRLKIDPALSGAVILTTVSDVVGFTAFLGLATYFLL